MNNLNAFINVKDVDGYPGPIIILNSIYTDVDEILFEENDM